MGKGEGRRFQSGRITGGKGDNLIEQEAKEERETETWGGRGGKVHTEGSPLQCDHNSQSSETTQLSITGRLGKETRAL